MKKNIRKIVIFMITAILLLPALPVVTQAARKTVISLKPGKTYKSYDFTGDAKKDKFKYVTYRGSDSSLYARVYINGKYKNAINLAQGGDLSLCRVSKKNVFLVASCGSFGGSHSICYVYKNGKFRDVTPAARSMLDTTGLSKHPVVCYIFNLRLGSMRGSLPITVRPAVILNTKPPTKS